MHRNESTSDGDVEHKPTARGWFLSVQPRVFENELAFFFVFSVLFGEQRIDSQPPSVPTVTRIAFDAAPIMRSM